MICNKVLNWRFVMEKDYEFDTNDIYKDTMFNPMAQYEQAYTYYKYLCMQMDYKIKCKEYEKLCIGTSSIKSGEQVK